MSKTSKWIPILALVPALWALAFCPASAADGGPRVFTDPDAAVEALVTAAKAHDVDALVALVGTPYARLFRTGDDAADRDARAEFADAASERVRLETGADGRVTIFVGYADWAFPVPLVKHGDGWAFDGTAGAQTVLDRRIGANEIAAITFCEAVYMAQSLYQATDHDGDGVHEYAYRLVSTPGRHDGLYWEQGPGEDPSPLGHVLGVAGPNALGTGPGASWMGYTFRLLCSQGPCAPGGAHGYMINGNMIAGFAVLGTPQRYGDSGIATFAMGPNSRVLQRDFGPSTTAYANRICAFSPDAGWTFVDRQP